MKKVISEQFDVLVIGGGAAGLLAAGRAAHKGARVALVEKNDRYGIKLLMTGNGRCNVTQDNNNIVDLASNYKNGRFLLSPLKVFGPKQLREFLKKNGVDTKVEKNGRVLPVSDQGKDVLDALYQYCRDNMVTFFNTEEVMDIVKEGSRISGVLTKKKEISAANYIIATGGKSYPATGSKGQGYAWAEKLGHKIIPPQPALVPIKVTEEWIEQLQGISAHTVGLSIFANNKKVAQGSGDIMFTHFGLSGPLALNMGREIAKVISDGAVKLAIDLKPELSFEKLDEIVRNDFEKNKTKQLVNCLHDLFAPKLLDFLLTHSGLDLKKHAANISKGDRQKLVKLFKGLEMSVDELLGFEKAMVTSGGVSTREIDSKTMRSKLIENLFFAGEIIDVDGPTGGYNLQVCWSTAYVAGENAARTSL